MPIRCAAFSRFNPRSRTGSDTRTLVERVAHLIASIHAPARGATFNCIGRDGQGQGFNPRSRTGSDACFRSSSVLHPMLQSTLPHGERQTTGAMGGTAQPLQSTLPHGERRQSQSCARRIQRFNPRSRTGSDERAHLRGGQIILLQSTLPHGERRKTSGGGRLRRRLQSTLPHGERLANP